MYPDNLADHVMEEERKDFKKKITTLRLKAHETSSFVPRHAQEVDKREPLIGRKKN